MKKKDLHQVDQRSEGELGIDVVLKIFHTCHLCHIIFVVLVGKLAKVHKP